MRPLDPRLLRHAGAVRVLIGVSALLGAVNAVCSVVLAVALADLITAYGVDGTAPASSSVPLLVSAVCVKALALVGMEAVPRRIAVTMVDQLRAALLDRVTTGDRGWLARQRPAELTQLATTGVGGLQNWAARYLPQLVLATLVPLGLVAYLVYADVLSGVIVAVTLPLVPVFMALVGLRTRDVSMRSWRTLQLLGRHFLDLIQGLPTLKVFGRSRSQVDGIRAAGDEYRSATLATLRIAFLSSLVLELLATISVALVAVSIGLRLVTGELDLRTGLTVLLVAPEAFAALRAVGTQFHASADGLAAADQILRIVDAPLPAPGTGPAPTGLLAVDATVHDTAVRLVAEPGRVTVLTGPSGVGKSTGLSLLAGAARPDAGTVTVAGVDLRDVDPDAWRREVGYLVQDPHLPAGSVRDAVIALRPDATDQEIEFALWSAAADGIVAELPQGLRTRLSEGAPELSQGQRARLALARTLLSDRPVVLLDEPTASLDLDTEAELVRRLSSALRGRTAVIASHRRAVQGVADQVVELRPADHLTTVGTRPAPTGSASA